MTTPLNPAGSHCTIVAHSIGVQTALSAAEELAGQGIECEVGFPDLDNI